LEAFRPQASSAALPPRIARESQIGIDHFLHQAWPLVCPPPLPPARNPLKFVLRTPEGFLQRAAMARPQCLTVGTECSGMELVPYALRGIGLRSKNDMALPHKINQTRMSVQGHHQATSVSLARP
jgi:hypothetical protein